MPRPLSPDDRLSLGAALGDSKQIQSALADGADIECESPEESMTPLMLAAMNADSHCVAILLASGANPRATIRESNYLDSMGLPQGIDYDALWFAANAGSKKCIQLLFDARGESISEFRLRACLRACNPAMKAWLSDYAHGGWESEALDKTVREAPSAPSAPRL